MMEQEEEEAEMSMRRNYKQRQQKLLLPAGNPKKTYSWVLGNKNDV